MSIKENISLSDYSLIGNCRSSALVSKYGSIDWCCMPEFHSPSVFAALLDPLNGGHFSILPAKEFTSVQKYITNTNVVETVFENSEGKVQLTDFFTALDEEDKKRSLFPDHELIRIADGISGNVTLHVEFFPRIYYGKSSPQLKDHGKLGIHFFYKENVFILQSTLEKPPIQISENKATTEFIIHPGERVVFSFSNSGQCPAIIPEVKTTAPERMRKTIRYWKDWISKCRYNGIFKEQVIRSALVLKLLTHAPSGAIIAAPTTSLPEELGGERNWDYRYCWLRDASFTIRVLLNLGFFDEARAYMNWILHATRLTRPKLQVMYTVYGESRIKEKICNWLPGYKNSRPVRIGNSAYQQFQLDVYGEVLDAVYAYSEIETKFDNDSKRFIIGLGNEICKLWEKPDEGIWEIRSSTIHHTHSKVMAWVGLDRLITLCRKYKWTKAPTETFEKTRDLIFRSIEQNGFNRSLNHYTREYNGSSPDASLLIFPLVNYCNATSQRMKSTMEAIQQKLQKKSFVYRYLDTVDGLTGKEGAFIICSFWLVENLAKSGQVEKAAELFNETIKYSGFTGLFSEEIDPDTRELLGNYPQGFSHIGLINAALTLDEAYRTKKEYRYEYR